MDYEYADKTEPKPPSRWALLRRSALWSVIVFAVAWAILAALIEITAPALVETIK
jgi:hypothetical protein